MTNFSSWDDRLFDFIDTDPTLHRLYEHAWRQAIDYAQTEL